MLCNFAELSLTYIGRVPQCPYAAGLTVRVSTERGRKNDTFQENSQYRFVAVAFTS